MAKKKKQNGGFQGKGDSKRAEVQKMAKQKKRRSDLLVIGVLVIALGVIGASMVGLLRDNNQGLVQLDTAGAEVVSIEAGESGQSLAAAATDRETRYLGPDSNSAALTLAESGNAPLDAPTLVWFHADW